MVFKGWSVPDICVSIALVRSVLWSLVLCHFRRLPRNTGLSGQGQTDSDPFRKRKISNIPQEGQGNCLVRRDLRWIPEERAKRGNAVSAEKKHEAALFGLCVKGPHLCMRHWIHANVSMQSVERSTKKKSKSFVLEKVTETLFIVAGNGSSDNGACRQRHGRLGFGASRSLHRFAS